MTTRARYLLAVTALILAAGAALGGRAPNDVGRIDVAELSRAVAREDDHVTAVELADWIKARKPRLRIIDLRTEADYAALHIPTAERAAIDSLGGARLSHGETIVLYSDAGAHSAQAWVFLKALGYDDVFFLRGGILEWMDEVVSPGLPADATDAERARFDNAAELSRYFGGTPRIGVSRDEKAASVKQVKRRGC